jgi:hypothetical protein
MQRQIKTPFSISTKSLNYVYTVLLDDKEIAGNNSYHIVLPYNSRKTPVFKSSSDMKLQKE